MDKFTWSDEQKAQISKWLTEHWGVPKPCPMCGAEKWSVGPAPALVVRGAVDTGDMMLGGGYPSFVVVCGNCGNTVIVNTIVAGLHKAPETNSPPSENKEASNG